MGGRVRREWKLGAERSWSDGGGDGRRGERLKSGGVACVRFARKCGTRRYSGLPHALLGLQARAFPKFCFFCAPTFRCKPMPDDCKIYF
jgi:hypothetical protein